MAVSELPVAIIQEGSAFGMEFSLFDLVSGATETPTLIKYVIHDESTGSQLSSGTVPAASTFEVTLPASINTLVNGQKHQETRILTIYIEYVDDTDPLVIETRYHIKRSKYLTDAKA